jgi:hypothetical protein
MKFLISLHDEHQVANPAACCVHPKKQTQQVSEDFRR